MYNCVESYIEITVETEATGTCRTCSAPGQFAMHEQDSRQGTFFCQRLAQAPSASSGVKISARTPWAESKKLWCVLIFVKDRYKDTLQTCPDLNWGRTCCALWKYFSKYGVTLWGFETGHVDCVQSAVSLEGRYLHLKEKNNSWLPSLYKAELKVNTKVIHFAILAVAVNLQKLLCVNGKSHDRLTKDLTVAGGDWLLAEKMPIGEPN